MPISRPAPEPSPVPEASGGRVRAFLDGAGGQLVRYAITGGGLTALAAGIYWVVATPLKVAPLVANLAAYVFAVVAGYVVHSRWSFRGHGRRDNVARTTSRFFVASLVSLGLNSVWVWLLTGVLDGPTWWPVVPMIVVTPLAMFWLNRQWVFE